MLGCSYPCKSWQWVCFLVLTVFCDVFACCVNVCVSLMVSLCSPPCSVSSGCRHTHNKPRPLPPQDSSERASERCFTKRTGKYVHPSIHPFHHRLLTPSLLPLPSCSLFLEHFRRLPSARTKVRSTPVKCCITCRFPRSASLSCDRLSASHLLFSSENEWALFDENVCSFLAAILCVSSTWLLTEAMSIFWKSFLKLPHASPSSLFQPLLLQLAWHLIFSLTCFYASCIHCCSDFEKWFSSTIYHLKGFKFALFRGGFHFHVY